MKKHTAFLGLGAALLLVGAGCANSTNYENKSADTTATVSTTESWSTEEADYLRSRGVDPNSIPYQSPSADTDRNTQK